MGVLCLAVTGVPKNILPGFTGSGTGLQEEFSDRSRDHGELRSDILSWVICEFSTDSLEGLSLCMYCIGLLGSTGAA